ncbi:MAG: hypothetical protein V4691_03185 [Pseudomonadota bacterium]
MGSTISSAEAENKLPVANKSPGQVFLDALKNKDSKKLKETKIYFQLTGLEDGFFLDLNGIEVKKKILKKKDAQNKVKEAGAAVRKFLEKNKANPEDYSNEFDGKAGISDIDLGITWMSWTVIPDDYLFLLEDGIRWDTGLSDGNIDAGDVEMMAKDAKWHQERAEGLYRVIFGKNYNETYGK